MEPSDVQHNKCSCSPVYIGRDSGIMEGCMIKDLCAYEHASLKMGAKIYGATKLLAPHCKGWRSKQFQ